MKKQGFTLVELLISMTILSIAIGMSSIVFGTAIRQPKQLQPAVVSNSEAHSALDHIIHDIEAQESPNYVKYPYNLRFGSVNVNNVEGHFISYDGKEGKKDEKTPGDKVKSNHKLITFLGRKFDNTVVISNMKNLYFNTVNRFVYMPIASADVNLEVVFEAQTSPQLKKVRTRFLKSSSISRIDGFIHGAYADNVVSYPNHPDLNPSEFLYTGEVMDSADNVNSGKMTKTIKSYTADKEAYLDAIDHSYIAEAITLNKSGFSSAPFHTQDALVKQNNENRAMHIIGLPYVGGLLAHYDYNLVISKSNENEYKNQNKYYSLYDIEMANRTIFNRANAIISADGENYRFDWGKNDVRNITKNNPNIGNISQIKLAPSFFNKIKLSYGEPGTPQKEYPNVKKPYGNTAYFSMSSPIAEIEVPTDKNYTFFAKFKLRPEEDSTPVNLLSYNFDLKAGKQVDERKYGFSIFADSTGELHINKVNEFGAFVTEKLDFNLNHTGIYSDDDFAFDVLSGGSENERDARENFNILAATIKPYTENNKGYADIKLYFLQKHDISGTEGKYERNTKLKVIEQKVLISSNPLSSSSTFEFLGGIDKIVRNDVPRELTNADKKIIAEVSDVLLYDSDLSQEKFASSNADYLNLTMDYLFRRYLTQRERKEGGFDKFFMNKY